MSTTAVVRFRLRPFAGPRSRPRVKDPVDEVNERIHRSLLRELEGRNRADLCRKANVAESTLSTQLAKQRFTLELVAPMAKALGVTIGDLADPPRLESVPADRAPRLLEDIERLLERARR